MPLGGPKTKQHVVEFISDATIGGIYTDGVRDSTTGGTAGPWTWTVPNGVTRLVIEGCGPGGGGGGGQNTGTPGRGGGGGGGSGVAIRGAECFVAPGTLLTVTLGAAGAGGAAGSSGTGGGITTVAGITRGPFVGISGGFTLSDTLRLVGGGPGLVNGTAGSGGGAGGSGIQGSSSGFVTSVLGQAAAATPPTATNASEINLPAGATGQIGGFVYCTSGAVGGAASTVGTTAGATGGGITARILFGQNAASAHTGGTGAQDGTISRGGGGRGGCNPFGMSGPAGNASGSASAGIGFGHGGSGGGADGAGAAGGPSLVRIFYEGAD
ncbi:MAG: hypothetical protein ACK515_02600 [bacterium]